LDKNTLQRFFTFHCVSGRNSAMKSRFSVALIIAFIGFVIFPAKAAFSSIYVFGDSISSTTGNTVTGSLTNYYYGKRYSNGRVWVEVLAQQQGLTLPAANNTAYFYNTSDSMVTEVKNFNPTNPGSALVVLWVNNADLFDAATYDGNNTSQWTADINQSQSNHYKAITNLYAKGIRTLIMPNAVDISTIPQFNVSIYKNTIHQQCIAYNNAFNNTLNQAKADCPGLVIYVPDFYSLLTSMLAYPGDYGLTNALMDGLSIDAMDDPALNDLSLNGPGGNYIFWDYADPTAKVHYIMATYAQQLVSPVRIAKVAPLGATIRLDVVNMPVGLDGFVDGATNLTSTWTAVTNFTGTVTTQSVSVPTPVFSLPPYPPFNSTNVVSLDPNNTNTASSGTGGFTLISAGQFYQLRFPANWTWP
jgi:phospholipase/lecithinase/hemolysin